MNETKFKYIDEDIQDWAYGNQPVLLEIAHQLKRIADQLRK